MTLTEMTEIFAAMSFIYPDAKMFTGGPDTLEATIKIWTKAMPEIDFWTGRQALVRVFRECKYSPTPADFLKAAQSVTADVKSVMENEKNNIMLCTTLYESIEEGLKHISLREETKKAILAIGGPDKLTEKLTGGGMRWQWESFETAFMNIVKEHTDRLGSGTSVLN